MAKGLGDTIEAISIATGIKTLVERVEHKTGKSCGCNKRRQTLNEAFPYKQK